MTKITSPSDRKPDPEASGERDTVTGPRRRGWYGTIMSMSSGEITFAVEEAAEGGYVARALGHDIFTEADTIDTLREAVRDAVVCHFDEGDRLAAAPW